MADVKFYRHEPGICQNCGQNFYELYTAEVSYGTTSESYVLCGGCSNKLQEKINKYEVAEGQPYSMVNGLTCNLCGQPISPVERFTKKQDNGETIYLCESCSNESLNEENDSYEASSHYIPNNGPLFYKGAIWIIILKICAILGIIVSSIVGYMMGDLVEEGGLGFFAGLLVGLVLASALMAFSNLCEDVKEILYNQKNGD